MTSLFPPRESLVSDISAEDGNIEKHFVRCIVLVLAPTPVMGLLWQPGSRLKGTMGKSEGELTVYNMKSLEKERIKDLFVDVKVRTVQGVKVSVGSATPAIFMCILLFILPQVIEYSPHITYQP